MRPGPVLILASVVWTAWSCRPAGPSGSSGETAPPESLRPAVARAAGASASEAGVETARETSVGESPKTDEGRAQTGWHMPMPAESYNVREGRALFEHYCVTCHGSAGHGDGFNAYALDPKPRDLSDRAFQAQRSDQELAGVIRGGGGAAGLSDSMPPWGKTLNERQIGNLVDFVRTLRPEPD